MNEDVFLLFVKDSFFFSSESSFVGFWLPGNFSRPGLEVLRCCKNDGKQKP